MLEDMLWLLSPRCQAGSHGDPRLTSWADCEIMLVVRMASIVSHPSTKESLWVFSMPSPRFSPLEALSGPPEAVWHRKGSWWLLVLRAQSGVAGTYVLREVVTHEDLLGILVEVVVDGEKT